VFGKIKKIFLERRRTLQKCLQTIISDIKSRVLKEGSFTLARLELVVTVAERMP
jgi:hypothetical protein